MQGSITPEQFIANIARSLPKLSEAELARLKKHARAWATVFYSGAIPVEIDRSLTELEAQHATA